MARFTGLKLMLPASLTVALLACSSPSEPGSGVTLSVVNWTCQPGPCATIRVLGFPSDQPETPGPYWQLKLGQLSGPSGCFTIPASRILRSIDVGNNGLVDTTTITWTLDMPFSIGAVPTSGPIGIFGPSTRQFVPSRAAGWKVVLPDGDQISPAPACTP